MSDIHTTYLVLFGKYNEKLQLLLDLGFQPFGGYDFMKARIDVSSLQDEDPLHHFWWDNSFFTADGCMYSADLRVRVAQNFHMLGFPLTNLRAHGVPIKRRDYEDLSFSYEFPRNLVDDRLISDEYSRARLEDRTQLRKEEAAKHGIIRAIAHYDEEVHAEYTECVFEQSRRAVRLRPTGMAVWVPPTRHREYIMYAWEILSDNYGAGFHGKGHLDLKSCYVLGKKDEVRQATRRPTRKELAECIGQYLGVEPMKLLEKQITQMAETSSAGREFIVPRLEVVMQTVSPHLGRKALEEFRQDISVLY